MNFQVKNFSKKTKGILIETLIFLVKISILLKRFLTAFFIVLIYKPGRTFLRFIFYKIIVKLYCKYVYLIKRLGWENSGKNFISFLLNQKLVHVLVVILTIFTSFSNLTHKSKAGTFQNVSNRPIISGLISNEFGQIISEEELIEEIMDEAFLAQMPKQKYIDNTSAINQQMAASLDSSEIEFDNSALDQHFLENTPIILTDRKETVEYEVKPGDTISTIAAEFGISVNTVLWENNLTVYNLIRPGDKLSILPVSGISHVIQSGETLGGIASKYNIDENEIIKANNIENAARIAISQKLIIPGGTKIAVAPKTRLTDQTQSGISANQTQSGISAIRDLIKPSDASPVSSNKMNWPTVGSRITQYFSWRHAGVDIANKTGTAIYAADAGTVESAGWNNGYGYNIIINHGGGKKTRYAHFSKLYLENGQKVKKGEVIGEMGSTGWSTGSHLHFEIIINGIKHNPLNYIK